MFRKILKDLRKVLPALTKEQLEAWNTFEESIPAEPYKTFLNQDEFDTYIATKTKDVDSEAVKELKALKSQLREGKLKGAIDTVTPNEKHRKLLLSLLTPQLTGDETDKEVDKKIKSIVSEYGLEASNHVQDEVKLIPKPLTAEAPKSGESETTKAIFL